EAARGRTDRGSALLHAGGGCFRGHDPAHDRQLDARGGRGGGGPAPRAQRRRRRVHGRQGSGDRAVPAAPGAGAVRAGGRRRRGRCRDRALMLLYIDPTGGLPPSMWISILSGIIASLGAAWFAIKTFGRQAWRGVATVCARHGKALGAAAL